MAFQVTEFTYAPPWSVAGIFVSYGIVIFAGETSLVGRAAGHQPRNRARRGVMPVRAYDEEATTGTKRWRPVRAQCPTAGDGSDDAPTR